jgi:hypothetical protein
MSETIAAVYKTQAQAETGRAGPGTRRAAHGEDAECDR